MYYEVARVESLRKLGLTYKSLEAQGIIMPVLENKSKYIAPAYYDDLLRIVCFVREKPGVRIRFNYEIFNEDNKLIHIGETLLVFVDRRTSKPRALPEAMEKVLEPFFK
jgi:acyl-CoA thioester hydrolase